METNVDYEAVKVKKPSLFGIITSPALQFQRMEEKVPIRGPLVIMMIIMLITGALTSYISLNNPLVKNTLNGTAGFQIPPGLTIGMGAVGGLIGGAVMFFIMAAIYKIFMMLLGNDTTYKKLVSIVIYTSIISSLGILLNLLIAVAVGGYELTYTSLAPLAGSNQTLKAILGGFDIFQIWHYVVLGMAFHIAAGLSKNKATTLIVIFFILGILLNVAGTFLPQTSGL